MPTKAANDAPNYRPAPAGYDRCSSCYFYDPSGNCTKYNFKAESDYLCDSYKPGSGGKDGDKPTEEKAAEGIPSTLGATLVARVYDRFVGMVNGWLSDSDITIDEHRVLVGIGGDLIDFITSAVPSEIIEREKLEDPYMDMFFWAADGAQQLKSILSREKKAGRVLSQANATKLVTAVEQIDDVLTVAGIREQAKEVEADVSTEKGSQPTQSQAEPETPLTLSEDDKLIQSFKAAQQSLAELKGVKKDDVSGEPRAS